MGKRAIYWLLLACVACSAQRPKAGSSNNGVGERADGAVADAAFGAGNPSAAVGGGADAAAGGGAKGADAGALTVPTCVKQAAAAQQAPVDMYIMLDRSGSMTELTGAGPSKWDAVRDALSQFVNDPRSAGLGVGLQYFPLGQPGVPESCTSDSDCGSTGGACLTKACQPSQLVSIPFTVCLSDADCPLASPGCAPYGICEKDATLACFNLGANGCGAQGACSAAPAECLNFASCDVPTYAAPAVAIKALPGNAAALLASLRAETPVGLTPTSAALSGALQAAGKQARAAPTHRVITVLATDGIPTQCNPTDATGVANIAAQGLAQTPQVRTYVIGVFAPSDTAAPANLDAWAKAGGSDSAFIVDPTQNVSTQFLDAMQKIRGGVVSCEYLLPPAPVGSSLDLGQVNVALIEPTRTRDAFYVGDAGHCSATQLGWYYDAPPASGSARKILVCPQTCTALHAASDVKVEIRLGCKTMGPE